MTLDILNPGGRDPDQSFPDAAGSPSDVGHPPVNYHGYAACMAGNFRRKAVGCDSKHVLVLIRKRNMKDALHAVRELKKRGLTVLLSCKESGSHQIAELLGDPKRWLQFCELCREAHGAISSTPELTGLYLAAGARLAEFIPTPYPLECPDWNFSKPLADRAGIFIGTREFDVPSRNHMAALIIGDSLSRDLECPLTIVNSEGRRGRAILSPFQKANFRLRVLDSLPYPAYLEEMATHRIVWQLDSSSVPGQVAGDALLCRMPCLGGNGAVDRLAFPEWSGQHPQEILMEKARTLILDDNEWKKAAELAVETGIDQLAFSAVSKKLEAFFTRLHGCCS